MPDRIGRGLNEAVAGERKQATVLFADIVGSTAMISELELEQAAARLDPILRGMAEIVGQHGGFVAGMRGDGIKAVFGVPLAQEDHPDRACAAALAIGTLAKAASVLVRVGLHSGEVLVRRLPNGVNDGFDAVGMTVHLAARLEQAARPATVCLSAATARLLNGRFSLRSAGMRTAKGVPGEFEVFELLSRLPATRWSARRSLGLTRLVGRRAELGRLLAVPTSPWPVMCVSGEPGSGKSRLLYELLRRRPLRGWTVMKAEAGPDDGNAGLRPFAHMLRVWLGVGRRDTPVQIRARLDDKLTALGGSQDQSAALCALLDVAQAGFAPAPEQARTAEALRRVILHCSERGPVMVIAEDIHWLDEDARNLLGLLSQAAQPDRLAVIMTTRPGGRPPPGGADTLHLLPLSDNESLSLLAARLGNLPTEDGFKARIVARAGGVPLFIEEMARLAAETGDAGTHVPESVHAVIAERIDRLPLPSRETLRIAAVIGREAAIAVLCQVMASSEDALTPHLALLEQAGFARITEGGGERRLEFSHVLTQEVAAAGLVSSNRRAIHDAVAAAYEALYPQRLDELVERLGAHSVEACNWEKAERYLRQAAQKAIERSSHATAIQFTEQALHALGRSRVSPAERDSGELVLRMLLRTAYNAVGNYRERLGNLDRAESLARSIGREDALPAIWVSRANSLLQLGRASDAERLCAQARIAAAAQQDDDAGISAGYTLSRIRFYSGRLIDSLADARQAIALLRGLPKGAPRFGGGFGSSSVMLLTQFAQTSACLGHLADGLDGAVEAMAAAKRSQRSFDLALASYGLGVARFYAGDLATVITELEQGMKASALEGTHSIYAALASLLSYGYLRAGRLVEGLSLTRRVLAYPETSLYHGNWPRLFGAMVLDAAGKPDEALRLAGAALEVARKSKFPVQMVWSDLALARLCRADRRTAARHLTRALAESERMGLRPCAARALLGLAELSREAGRSGAGQDFEQKGRAIAMEIGLWLGPGPDVHLE